MSKCRLPECPRVLRGDFLFCTDHWNLVPLPLRRDLRVTAYQFRRAHSRGHARELLAAVNRCVHAVREREVQRNLF